MAKLLIEKKCLYDSVSYCKGFTKRRIARSHSDYREKDSVIGETGGHVRMVWNFFSGFITATLIFTVCLSVIQPF